MTMPKRQTADATPEATTAAEPKSAEPSRCKQGPLEVHDRAALKVAQVRALQSLGRNIRREGIRLDVERSQADAID